MRLSAFENCKSLESLTFKKKTALAGGAFYCGDGEYQNKSLKELVFPDGTNLIGSMFARYAGLVSVIAEGDISVGDASFSNCGALKTVIFNGDVLELYGLAFKNCEAISTVVFKKDVVFDPNGYAFGNYDFSLENPMEDHNRIADNIMTTRFETVTPPSFPSEVFGMLKSANITFEVPCVSVDDYKTELGKGTGTEPDVTDNSEFADKVVGFHSFTNKASDQVASATTCTEPAYYYVQCDWCDEVDLTKTVAVGELDPIAHDWGVWTSISDTQHQRVCKNDASHVETENHAFSGRTCTACSYTKSSGSGHYTPAPAPKLPFKDVSESDTFYDDVYYAYFNDLMVGVSDTLFAPYITLSRGMIVTILYRIEGEPAFMNDNIFSDVETGSWYEKAVVWANSKGIVLGYGNGKFGPSDPVTREQLAAILYRYEQYRGGGFKGSWMFPLNYADAQDVSSYANEAMHWTVMNGLMDDSNGRLYPRDNATRAVVATFLHRFCVKFGK